jgi:colanic acid/amylovoran biosynthesis glycosyltransferase
MKVAYLAPELPALSATFVYNEIIALERLGNRVIPFSVHCPMGSFKDKIVNGLKQRVTTLYGRQLSRIVGSHLRLLRKVPKQYFCTLIQLMTDMIRLGFQRNTAGIAYRFVYAGVLADELLKHRCQHIHVHFAHIPTDIAMYASKISDIGFSVTSHANDLFERGWLLKEKVERSCFFGTISEFNERFLAERGVNMDKVKVIRCGVDLTQFKTRRWKALGQPVQVGVVGRLVEKKGIDVLIRAMALLKAQGISFKLTIVGNGPLESELKALVTTLELGENIIFLGALSHNEISDYIKSLDIFALPCKRDVHGDMDGVPVVLMEAMLAGVPVVSTQISGIPELVIDGMTGYCIAAPDENVLANTIGLIMTERTKTKQMASQAVSHVKDMFSLEGNARLLNDLIVSELG